MQISRGRLLAAAAAVAGLGIAGWIWSTVRHASATLDESRAEIAAKDTIRFDSAPLDGHPKPGFEMFSSAAQFSDAAVFQGHIFLCGPGGLAEYDADGALIRRLGPGAELPPAPLVRMHTGVAADAQGEQLYIATSGEGLLAYDGHILRQIRPQEPALRKLTAVLPGKDGRILIGTAKNGLMVYDGKRITPFLPGIAVTELAGTESDLWIGTLDQGLLHSVAGRLERMTETMPDQRVTAIELASDGRVFAATPMGVAEIRNSKVERVLAKGFFTQTLLVNGKRLYAGTLMDGTLEIPLEAKHPPLMPIEVKSGEVKRVLQAGGRIIELRRDTLLANGQTLLGKEPTLLTDSNISAIAPDSTNGKIWIGYFDRGLDIAGTSAKTIHVEDDHVYCINRIVHDAAHRKTGVATANGFVLFDGQGREQQVLTKRDGLIATHVTDALLSKGGSWTLATPAGVTFLEAGRTSSIYAMQGLVNNHVYSLGECGNKIVAGTLGGASVLEAGLVKASYTTSNSPLKQNWISAVVPVANGCFVGTYGAGVFELDKDGAWKSFPDMKAGVEINPNALLATEKAVYAGTLGKGLAVYQRESGRWSWIVDGLPSLNVTALAAAADDSIYVGTDNGLVRMRTK